MNDERWANSDSGTVRHYFKQDDEIFYRSLCGHLRLKTELGNMELRKCKQCLALVEKGLK